MNKEIKDILLIKGNPPGVQRGHPLMEEGLKELEAFLIERTEGKVWTTQFVNNRITRLEHPQGEECSTYKDGKLVEYSKNIYLRGYSGLMEPNFRLLKNFGAVVEVADNCPQEDGFVQYEPLLTIAPTLVIGGCNCLPYINRNFNTALYTISYRKGEENHGRLVNSKGNRIASIKSIEDMADFVTGMLLNNEAIQERATSRFEKLKADYETLTKHWEKQ